MKSFGPQSQTPYLSFRTLKHVRVNWSINHRPHFSAASILADRAHPLYESTKKKYTERRRDCLWWNVTSNTMAAKRVVRVWTNRRLRKAIIEALRTRGFDADGRVLDIPSSAKPAESLTGFLEVHGLSPIIKATHETIAGEARVVIDAFIHMSQNSKA